MTLRILIGDILEFYEGSKLVGNIQIIEIYNELLKKLVSKKMI